MVTHSSILAWRIPIDRGTWLSVVLGVTELDTTEPSTVLHCEYKLNEQSGNIQSYTHFSILNESVVARPVLIVVAFCYFGSIPRKGPAGSH